MKRFYLLCFLLISAPLVKAQSPGYLGKKTSIQFNFSSSLAWFGPTQNNFGSDPFLGDGDGSLRFPFGLNTKYGACINRVIGRRVSLEVGADMSKTGYHGEFETLSAFSGVQSDQYDFHKIFFNANVTDLYLSLRIYNRKKGSIAPLGLYLAPKIGYTMTQSAIVDRYTRPHYLSTGERINALGFSENRSFFTLGFGTGYNRILMDKVVLNLGWEFSYFIKTQPDDLSDLEGDTMNSWYQIANDLEQHQLLIDRLNFENMFMFRIGIGYLF